MRHCVDDLAPGETFTVMLNGENVSNRCFGFDTSEQWVDCYQRDDKGMIVITETYETVKERLFGEVVVYKDPKSPITMDEYNERAHSVWVKAFFRAKAYFKRIGAVR